MLRKKIGLRNIKTAIGVFLSIYIFIFLLFVDHWMGLDGLDTWMKPSNMYTPFFAGIAACYAVHKDSKSSFNQAKIRSVGSIFGGYYGMIIILITEWLLLTCFKMQNEILFKAIEFLIVSIGIIPLIHLTYITKKTYATFITLLTYLSVTISIRNGGMPVVLFATNRILSTLVGVGIALFVNRLPLLRRRNPDILFVSSLDNSFLDMKGDLSPYIKYKLNSVFYEDMALSFMTTRTMASLKNIFTDVNINQKVIVMNGGAIFDFRKGYSNLVNLSMDIIDELKRSLKAYFQNQFDYTIYENELHCYYNQLLNIGEQDYYLKRKGANFTLGEVPSHLPITQIVVIDTLEQIEAYHQVFLEKHFDLEADFTYYPYEIQGYYYLKIDSKEARKENAINSLMQNHLYLVVLGSGTTDIPLMKKSDLSVCLENAPLNVKSEADYVISGDNPEKALKLFDQLFHTKKPKEKMDKLKNVEERK